jgi:hypothetical protein
MKCSICEQPARSQALFKKGEASEPGYLVLGDEVSFDSDRVGEFVYFCAEHGLHLNSQGVVDLCPVCSLKAKASKN